MSDAELLLVVAKTFKYPRAELIALSDSWQSRDTARLKIALDFDNTSSAFKLRALMENWDMIRIVRELY